MSHLDRLAENLECVTGDLARIGKCPCAVTAHGHENKAIRIPRITHDRMRMCARTSFGRALTATGGTPWRPWGPVTEGVDQAGLWDVSRRAGTLRLPQVPEVYLKSRCEGVPGALRKKSR